MNKFLKKLKVLRSLSVLEATGLVGRSLLGLGERDGRPRDEFVFADAAGYVLEQGGACRRVGGSNRLTLPVYEHVCDLAIEVRRGTSDAMIFNQVFRSREYGPCVELVWGLGPAQVTVVDAGSNIGCSPVWWCCVFPGARVAAIELEAGNFRQLTTNVALNGLQDAVVSFHRALWTNEEPLSIGTGFRDGREYAFTAQGLSAPSDPAQVHGITMAQIREKMGWDDITLLKMDIEGGEAALLEDEARAAETLRGVRILALEIHDEVADRARIEANVQRLGFALDHRNETLFGIRRTAG